MCGLFASLKNPLKFSDFNEVFNELRHRGPDDTELVQIDGEVTFGFHRLAIRDTTSKGNQPLIDSEAGLYLICNGEVYNYELLKEKFDSTYKFISHSDCEVILPLFKQYGVKEAANRLDAEFAFVIYDQKKNKLFAARDPMGIRPLFYGYSKIDGTIMFASEAKTIMNFCSEILPFPPGNYFEDGMIKPFHQLDVVQKITHDSDEIILKNIREKFIEGVRKRLASDVPIGFLLSGGLDSSLVCGIAVKILNKKITTFSVGMYENPIDIKYAKIVADFIKSDHHEVYFSEDDTLKNLRDVIWHLESWDITTIRASIGMYLVCKHIREKSNIKVLLTGEVSDELFGYKYTDFAPNGNEFQAEAEKRVRELYLYDVLRADRCIAAHSLEARVPFGDKDFVSYVMSIPGEKKLNTTRTGKYLLRKAFDGMKLIPDEILWREKAAFSDAVGHGMVDTLKAYAESLYTDADFTRRISRYDFATPISKESLMYRDIFEEMFPGKSKLIKDFWMPNKNWENCNVNDPSARVLPNYGASGV